MSKHIVIDARIINTSTGTYVERLLHYLQKIDKKNRYTILIPLEDKEFWKPSTDNFFVDLVDIQNYSLKEQTSFKKYLDSLQPDLVHFCMPQQPVLYKGRKVTTVHDLTLLKVYNSDKNWFVFKLKQHVGKFIFKRVSRDSQAVIVPTEYTKKDLLNFVSISPNKVFVTYEAADVDQHELEEYNLPFQKYLLNVGQHSDYKNIVKLAESHQKLLKKYPKLGLVLINRPTDALLANKRLFEQRGYKNIHFTYGVSKGQRDYIYQRAAVYVTPSLREGFGLTGLEAMGYGAPVVSSNATCLPEVYGDAAHYFDPYDVDDMTRTIDDVLSDEKLRTLLIKTGHEQVKKYSWQRMAKQTHSVYMDVLKEN